MKTVLQKTEVIAEIMPETPSFEAPVQEFKLPGDEIIGGSEEGTE